MLHLSNTKWQHVFCHHAESLTTVSCVGVWASGATSPHLGLLYCLSKEIVTPDPQRAERKSELGEGNRTTSGKIESSNLENIFEVKPRLKQVN